MISTNKTVEIYYLVDEFLKEYDAVIKSHSLEEGAPKKRRNRKFRLKGQICSCGGAITHCESCICSISSSDHT